MSMFALRPLLACAILLLLASCSGEGRNKSKTSPEVNDKRQGNPGANKTDTNILFEDPMTANWQENWFLDGQKATLEHRNGGLYFAGGTVTKKDDPKEYHAHHALLWTKQEFEGDLFISFEMTRVDTSNYGNTLIYIQAQGIGKAPYEEDISAWSERRTEPAMDKYFNYMNLLSISLRENIRCRRYPWNDVEKNVPFKGPLIEPMYDYGGIATGKTYRIEIEKITPILRLRLYDAESGNRLTECIWDTSVNTEDRKPHLIQKGRIGLRHMATKQFIYKNFTVKKIVATNKK
jgi:hypothetical protein